MEGLAQNLALCIAQRGRGPFLFAIEGAREFIS